MKKLIWAIFAMILIGSIVAIFTLASNGHNFKLTDEPKVFDSQRAYQDVLAQVEFGPRIPGSEAHQKTIHYIESELTKFGWKTEIQELEYQNHIIKNIIAKRGAGNPLILLGAHYDSRLLADRDPDAEMQKQPVPGANDGASGVAILLELCRVLPKDIQGQVWLVFFDAEDQGNISGWDWILGSRAFADQLIESPDAVVIVDMVGDAGLNIYYEKNSNSSLREEIWRAAEKMGYDQHFIPEEKFAILDDHIPFIEKGLSAVDIIDFNYPFWHTSQDTPDKVSPESLQIVGDTLLEWLVPKITVGKN